MFLTYGSKFRHHKAPHPMIMIQGFVCLFVCLFVSRGAAAQRGSWPPHSRGFLITHNDAPQSVELLWTSDQLVAETCT
jgi:hypothetical protein